MSYDLMVFDPKVAPFEKEAFMQWFSIQIDWPDFEQPCPAAMHAWYQEMLKTFPNINEMTDAELEADEESGMMHACEYSFSPNAAYLSFVWSAMKKAHALTLETSQKHNLGFFNPSSAQQEIVR